MGTFGLSYVGAVFLLCLLAPNLLWAAADPGTTTPPARTASCWRWSELARC